jgi:hypothetical protein
MTNNVVDRTGWARGPWDDEPDRVEWRSAAGYPALIVRGPMGSLCGYVGLPPGHPMHGKNRSDTNVEELDAHGGITYAAACAGDICHVPGPGESDDVWWLGFDCAHAGDYSPGLGARLAERCGEQAAYFWPGGFGAETYRTVEFVRIWVERLASELKATARSVVGADGPS